MTGTDPPTGRTSLRIVVDDREGASRLPAAIASVWPNTAVGRLPIGDVEVGPRVLIERKTVRDFVASLEDGRLFRQAHGLNSVCHRPLIVLEGEDAMDLLGLPAEAFRGVLLSLMLGYRIPVLRTGTVAETAAIVGHIAKQEIRRLARAGARRKTGGAKPGRETLDVLSCIPGIGDFRARKLVDEFGSVRGVANASEKDLTRAPGIGPASARKTASTLGGDS